MNLHLAPTQSCKLIDHEVLWHQSSNNYSIVSSTFVSLINHYLKARNRNDFVEGIQATFGFDEATALKLATDITQQLEAASTVEENIPITPASYDTSLALISKYYRAVNFTFQIKAQHKGLLQYVHPALAHLECENSPNNQIEFYISENADGLHLFLNQQHCGSFAKKNYHLLQGRFIMLLLGALHQQRDEDWMASFHASTIAKNGKAVMLTGASGKGKSTLTALLAFNGFEFVSDDVTGMLYPNREVYSYPAAISIKAGAFEVLKPIIPELSQQPLAENHPKGQVKFLPVAAQTPANYPCNDIVLVHYHPTPVKAQLKPIPTVKALETLIPDTWISPKPEHARAFLDWLPGLKTFELHYHHNADAINLMENLFKN